LAVAPEVEGSAFVVTTSSLLIGAMVPIPVCAFPFRKASVSIDIIKAFVSFLISEKLE